MTDLADELTRRYTRHRRYYGGHGTVIARAQEKVDSPSFLSPDKEKLAREHEHTFRDLNASFFPPAKG